MLEDCSIDVGWDREVVMQLTKHHGLANDFLVVLDECQDTPLHVDGNLARALCDRRTGVGADGLIHGSLPSRGEPGDIDMTMTLFNSDGSRAEISGNGIRCLGQAVAMARGLDSLDIAIATDGGTRRLEVRGAAGTDTCSVSVEMGEARPGPSIPGSVLARCEGRVATVDMGNPHLVIETDDLGAVDLASVGPWFESQFQDGVNVEFVAVGAGGDAIDLIVWERGAGITQACGTGACAAAHVARGWGAVGDDVRVGMPGGEAHVHLTSRGVVLEGPATYIATVIPADV